VGSLYKRNVHKRNTLGAQGLGGEKRGRQKVYGPEKKKTKTFTERGKKGKKPQKSWKKAN